MTTPKKGRPKVDVGRDLRADLIKISLELLEEGGPTALSLREVARRAGCTHQAPYHYFADRESVLAELITQGFSELGQRLEQANHLAATQSLEDTLKASASAYIGFALENRSVFRLMFRRDVCDPMRFPHLLEAGKKAFDALLILCELCFREKTTKASATIMWSHVHGISCLMIDGPLLMQFATAEAIDAHLSQVAEEFAKLILNQAGEKIK